VPPYKLLRKATITLGLSVQNNKSEPLAENN